ncbi:MAG: M81 family metallopeptidase [Planctomycetaceae bacterium]
MRVGIAAIALESNTFNPVYATLDDFRANTLLTGDAVRSLATTPHEVAGFLAGLEAERIVAVPLLAASAVAGGIATADTFDRLLDMLDRELDRAGPLDGLLLAPHGAMVAEQAPDADGVWMSRLRERIGPRVPAVATCDPHANVSPQMVAATDALIAYRTNPHLDQRDRGVEAARLIARTLRGETRPVQSACFPPMLIGIERQLTTESPCADLCADVDRIRQRSGVLSASLILGFPYADVPDVGSATIVVTDGDIQAADNAAKELGRCLWKHRFGLLGNLTSVADAVSEAGRSPGTTCLLDMGDNIGGGSPGDGTALFAELKRQSVVPALGTLCDADAAAAAIGVGTGARIRLSAGGKIDRSADSLDGEFEVLIVTDGLFFETEVRHGGRNCFDQGPTAVVRCDGLTLMLTSRPCSPFSLGQITHSGLIPRDFRAIVAKGVHAPVAAYAPVCDRLLRVDTPGLTAADPTRFPFHRRRRPMFPFERDAVWDIPAESPKRAIASATPSVSQTSS